MKGIKYLSYWKQLRCSKDFKWPKVVWVSFLWSMKEEKARNSEVILSKV